MSPSSSSSVLPTGSAIPKIRAGDGRIVVEFDPYRGHTFAQLSCTYPLKLLSPRSKEDTVAIVYVLSYGGGLIGGDEVELEVAVREEASLMLLSQVRSLSYLWCRGTLIHRLVCCWSLAGFDESFQGQVYHPLSHSKAGWTGQSEFIRLDITESGDLPTYDRTRLEGRNALSPPRPGNLLQACFVQPTPNLPPRRWCIAHRP